MEYNLDYIKFPEGIFRKARKDKILKPLVFWYKLKPIHASGRFEIKSFNKTVQYFYGISRTTINFYTDVLIKGGLIKKHGDHYQLISYDKLFKIFGYDLKTYGKRKGKFKIDKVDVDYIPILEDRVDCGEMKLNIERQYCCLKETAPDEEVPNSFVEKEVRSNFFFDMTNTQLTKEAISGSVKKLYEYSTSSGKYKNIVTGISCRGLCKLLGFKSTKSVHDLKYRAAKHGLIHMISQSVRFRDFCGFKEEVLLKYFLRPDFRFKGKFGQPLEYQLCDNFDFWFE